MLGFSENKMVGICMLVLLFFTSKKYVEGIHIFFQWLILLTIFLFSQEDSIAEHQDETVDGLQCKMNALNA